MLILLMSFATIGAQAQLEQAVKKIFAGDSITGVHASMKQESDSAYVANLQKTLETARLNEALNKGCWSAIRHSSPATRW